MPATGSYWTSIWHLNTNGLHPLETGNRSYPKFYSRIRESPFLPLNSIRQAVKECLNTLLGTFIQIRRRGSLSPDKWVTGKWRNFCTKKWLHFLYVNIRNQSACLYISCIKGKGDYLASAPGDIQITPLSNPPLLSPARWPLPPEDTR